jgi:hypothetical protein
MDIIIVADRSGKVRIIRVSKAIVALAGVVLIALMAALTGLLPTHRSVTAEINGGLQPHAPDERNPEQQRLLVKETLRASAAKLG